MCKKLVVLMSLLVAVPILWAQGPLPEATPGIPVDSSICVQFEDPPTLDGDLTDWIDAGAVWKFFGKASDVLSGREDGWDGPEDLSMTWSYMWDENYLYFAAAIADDLLVQPAGIGNLRADVILCFIDFNGDGVANEAGNIHDNTCVITIRDDVAEVWAMNIAGIDPGRIVWPDSMGGFVMDNRLGEGGRIIEVAIPMDDLIMLGMTPEIGGVFGINPTHEESYRATDPDGHGFICWLGETTPRSIYFQGPAPREQAGRPNPSDGEKDVLLADTTLRWKPGMFAAEHQIFFGEDYDTVNNADVPRATLPLDQAEYVIEEGFDLSKTYYWRVDEVNGVQTWKGNVWRFETELKAIPLSAKEITVTASSIGFGLTGLTDPQNLINGAGLDPNGTGQHNTNTDDMFTFSYSDPAPMLEFLFDRAYKLDSMTVWNHNGFEEAFNNGASIQDVVVSYLDEGAKWVVIEDVNVFAQASGTEDYTGETFDMGLYTNGIRIEPVSNYLLYPLAKYGLSEVAFNVIPNKVREMTPENGATEIDPRDFVLSWRAGREAVVHKVYFSTDEQAVLNRDVSIMTERMVPNMIPEELELGQTYYWCVDEVNDNEAASPWLSDTLSFTTKEALDVDNFDSYNDKWGNMVFQTWTDGLGWEDPDGNTGPGNGSGSGIGNWPPPTMERTIARSGQSMPFVYGLDNAADSYTTRNISADWSKYGAKSLSLWFYGDTENTSGQLYVKVNNARFDYDGAATDIQTAQWFSFTIDLDGVTDVDSFTIGVEGGSGTIYIDDIQLYRVTP